MAQDSGPLQFSNPAGHHDSERVDPRLLQESGGKTSGASLNLAAITTPPSPPDTPDDYTLDQLLDLTPAKRVAYDHVKLVERLEKHIDIVRIERDEHKNTCSDRLAEIDQLKIKLHNEEMAHSVLKTTRKGDRIKDAAVGTVVVIGAALISSFPKGNGWFAFGWAVLALAQIYQFIRSIFNVP